jgi:hypothetical protein
MIVLGLFGVAGSAAAAPAQTIVTMSCASATTCIGLGSYASPVGGASYFLQNWEKGHWGPVYDTIPGSGADGFDALSCASATSCVAVGNDINGFPATAVLTGTKWSVTRAPAPAGPSSGPIFLYAVSCATSRLCVALGQYLVSVPGTGQGMEGFIDTWTGAKWKLTNKQVPGNQVRSNQLNGVSCPSATRCVVVGGSYQFKFFRSFQQDQSYRPIVLVGNGLKWAASVAAAAPGKGHGNLTGVSCWSVQRCLAVGYDYPNSTNLVTGQSSMSLAEAWNGARWALTAKPPAPAATPAFRAVSCVSGPHCLAVGTTGRAAGALDTLKGLAASWNGKTWTTLRAATPPHATGSTDGRRNGWEVFDVQCAAAADCVTFGVAGVLGDLNLQSLFPFAEYYAGSRLVLTSDS